MQNKNLIRSSAFISLIICFSYCQPVKVSQTYCTPHFTKGNQFEGNINLGASGFNGYASYTPIKYFAVQVNGFSYPGNKYTHTYEAGGGFYLPYKKNVFAINAGYGQLQSDWQLKNSLGYSGYTLNKLKYYSEHTFIHVYFSHKKDSTNTFYNGASFKISDSFEHYINGSADANSSTGFPHLKNKSYHTQSYELSYFLKNQLANHLYFSMNVGFRYTPSPPSYEKLGVLFRIGLLLKL